MGHNYILIDRKVVEELDLIKWANWFADITNRRVKKTQVTDDIKVSTVFLGADHSFREGEPQFFETMVFGGKLDRTMDRYETWKEAEKGHDRMVNAVLNSIKGD